MSIGQRATQAIVREVSAIKAGNVHPHAPFDEMSVDHFVRAAQVIGHAIDQTASRSVGLTIEACVDAMMREVHCNTSLGTILLLVPLAKGAGLPIVPREFGWPERIAHVLRGLDSQDTRSIYAAIRRAKPGGLGEAPQMDVHGTAPDHILDAMQLAAEWDDIALQYANGFQQVFQIAERIDGAAHLASSPEEAIRKLQLELLAERPDSLISRKRGRDVAKEVQTRALGVVRSGPFGSQKYETAWKSFDTMLRSDGHALNPGTTADLIAAAIFQGMIEDLGRGIVSTGIMD